MNVKEWNESKNAKIKSLEEQVKFEKDNIINELKEMELTQKDVDYLYWSTDINVSIITESINKTAHELNQTPIEFPINCEDCNTNLSTVKIKTREKRKKFNPADLKLKTVCNTCQKVRDKNSVQHLRYMIYKDYLKTDHWLKLREIMLSKSGRKCQVCDKSNGELNVHHKNYERRGEELLTDLIVLCKSCHSKFHGTSVNPSKTTSMDNSKFSNAARKHKLGIGRN